ncbi:uncharacterized protein LOC103524116 [Trichonephila clavipes]|nr:uncharacterized protein LOC103524116 [Trichonephila clavipes]
MVTTLVSARNCQIIKAVWGRALLWRRVQEPCSAYLERKRCIRFSKLFRTSRRRRTPPLQTFSLTLSESYFRHQLLEHFWKPFGYNTLPYHTVARWLGKFQQGRVTTSDEQCGMANAEADGIQGLPYCSGDSSSRLPLLKPITFPGHLRYASVNLDLVLPVQKYNYLIAELRYAALATVPERYPDQDWLHVFTDGSATAFFAAIKTVSCYNLFPSKLELECKQFINSFLCTGREVVLQWIPSHCGIHGNEQAEELAKDALTLHPPCLPMCLRNAKGLLRDKFRQKRISTLTDLAVSKSWSRLLDGQRRAQISALPRVEGVACFRVIIGHDYLQTHLFKIGLDDSPLCLL